MRLFSLLSWIQIFHTSCSFIQVVYYVRQKKHRDFYLKSSLLTSHDGLSIESKKKCLDKKIQGKEMSLNIQINKWNTK